MTLPRSFKSWAVVGVRLTPMVVDTEDGNLLDAWPTGGGQDPLVVDAETVRECRAWAVKALAWLKASEKNGNVAQALRLEEAVACHARLASVLKSLSLGKGALADAAKDAYLRVSGDMADTLRAAHTEDLVDRCAEEMRRQAEDVLAVGLEVGP